MRVHIKVADRGWILERMAQELANNLENISVDTAEYPAADVQYYLTYSSYAGRVSPLELAYFTHIENDAGAAAKFYSVAQSVDHCVCQSAIAMTALSAKGIAGLTEIPPGVDLDRFKPIVRIGVVGRTYHTGRKGEHLVAQVMDIPGIEWVFTGAGWPGVSTSVADKDLPEFYRSLDYVLVPSLYEGGPMCVIEALACGVPVIAPPIGWVPKFPHIEFRTGDVEDLRRVLLAVVKERQDKRAAVQDYTWRNFVAAHDALFKSLQSRLPQRAMPSWSLPAFQSDLAMGDRAPMRVSLVTHGVERQAKGGPSLRVPLTAEGLRQLGVDARAHVFPGADLTESNIVHIFNVWPPEITLAALTAAKRLGRQTVFSPIYLNLSGRRIWHQGVNKAFQDVKDDERILDRLERVRERMRAVDRADSSDLPEPIPGYYARLAELVGLSDELIFLSDHERAGLSRAVGRQVRGSIVRNPIMPLNGGDGKLFADRFGVEDYVLCVGRLEARKNQLMLAYALRQIEIPLVLIGHNTDGAYLAKIKEVGGPNLRLIDRLPANSDMLASAFAGARVFALPSWSEGAPLAALEAASMGSPLVLSECSGEREYFGEFARYCDPGNPVRIREQILAAYERRPDPDARRSQAEHFISAFNFQQHCEHTLQVYHKLRARAATDVAPNRAAIASESSAPEAPQAEPRAPERLRLIVDLTSSAHVQDHLTGITRVEQKLAEFLRSIPGVDVSFCAWRPSDRLFVHVEPDAITPQDLKRLFANPEAPPLAPPTGGDFLIAGGAWMQNPPYARHVADLCKGYGLRLNVLIYDLIPVEFPFWVRPGYTGVFEDSLQILLENADRLMAISETSRASVMKHCESAIGRRPIVGTIRLGDDLSETPTGEVERSQSLPRNRAASPHLSDRFVLCVGAIHARKNYQVLYAAWLKLVEEDISPIPHLVIVGGTQVGGNEMRRAFEEDSRINRYVHVLDEVDDEQLIDLYQRSEFTVYPSLCEGWGLPVAESLNQHKICIAADIPSIREFVPDVKDLLDPLDAKQWAARIRMYFTSKSARLAREAELKSIYRPISWHETLSQAVKNLTEAVPGRVEAAKIYESDVIPFRDRHVGRPLIDVTKSRGIEFQSLGVVGHDVVVRAVPVLRAGTSHAILIRCRGAEPGNQKWRLLVDDHPAADWEFAGGEAITVSAAIPESAIGAGRAMTIRICLADSQSGQSGEPAPSHRIQIHGLCLTSQSVERDDGVLLPGVSKRAQVNAALEATSVLGGPAQPQKQWKARSSYQRNKATRIKEKIGKTVSEAAKFLAAYLGVPFRAPGGKLKDRSK